MRKIRLDSNEFISALAFGGRAVRLLHMAIEGDIEIAISQPIVTEVLRVLREKFDWQGYDIHAARLRIERIARVVDPRRKFDVITHDPPDNRVLECATEAASEFIITEDRDLLRLKRHGKARIVKVSDFLRLIREDEAPTRY